MGFLCGNGIFHKNNNNKTDKMQSIDFHSKEFLGREIKISFATRSHMPSDINKTHKTYSYTTNKKMGASINSIPSSIPRQSNNVSNNNSGDNMSSSSSGSSNN